MIDIHSHILPGLDDGAENFEQSFEILNELINQGVKEVIVTPHIISGSYDNNRKTIDEKFDELSAKIVKNKLQIKIHKGAEIYFEPNLIEKVKREKLSLAGSSYILVESDLQRFPNNFFETLFEFQFEDFIPILAHAERYFQFINNFDFLLDIANRGILIQTNCGCLLGDYGEKIQVLTHKMLEVGCIHFVASDVHNLAKRPILMDAAYQYLSEKYSENLAELLMYENPKKVINNEPFENIFRQIYQEKKYKTSFLERVKNFFS
ncbi:MAG: phosphoesterase [Candidatus Cloacimonetes bacterium]|nr:phosphoesterase [Candidatus Cloacimonadota bacterium]MBL7108544.1 phosphoesterase [Candidatus Cloacimonadota bacterium]